MVSFTPPSPMYLRAVVPVAHMHVRHGISVTLMTIDCYENAWTATFRVQGDLVRTLYPDFHVHRVPFRQSRDGGVSGVNWGANPNSFERIGSDAIEKVYVWTPALTLTEGDMQVWVPAISFTETLPSSTRILAQRVEGPWVFPVALSSARAVTRFEGALRDETVYANVSPEIAQGIAERRAERDARAQQDDLEKRREMILDAIYRHDPIGIAWAIDNPHEAEEYDTEANMIVERLREAQSEDDVRRLTFDVFSKMFGMTRDNEDHYRDLAAEIWRIWQAR